MSISCVMQFKVIHFQRNSMPEVPPYRSRYIYVHDEQKGPFKAIDIHHVFIRNNSVRDLLLICPVTLLLLAYTCYLLLVKEGPGIGFFWGILLGAILVKSLYWNAIKKESVVVMPAFGVQLETHYRSGRIVRRFVPIGKILKPLLNECVTPVTCYWSLALIIRGEADLMLVFQELRPPVKMLVPVWKALCAAIDDGTESTDKAADR